MSYNFSDVSEALLNNFAETKLEQDGCCALHFEYDEIRVQYKLQIFVKALQAICIASLVVLCTMSPTLVMYGRAIRANYGSLTESSDSIFALLAFTFLFLLFYFVVVLPILFSASSMLHLSRQPNKKPCSQVSGD